MSALEKAIITMQRMQTASRVEAPVHPGPVSMLLVTLGYLLAVLSMPLEVPVRLLWLAVYPIVAAPMVGLSFGTLLRRSLYIVPFVALFAAFNPVYDHVPVIVAGHTVWRGWLTLLSVIVRALLSFMALLLLVETHGFDGFCHSLRHLRVPTVLITQLLMVYRYLVVLMDEAVQMTRARRARGYAAQHLSLRMWGIFAGQLLIRTFARSERIHRAMLARGFDGTMPQMPRTQAERASLTSLVWFLVWSAAFIVLRFIDIPMLFR